MKEHLDPLRDLKNILTRVEKPGRYTGGEYGLVHKEGEGLLHVAISYPDLYEIGMSNMSVLLLYRLLNSLDGVYCERIFAPAPDFEAELRTHGFPIYSLETGRPLNRFDIVGFSVGYELTLTNLLNILDLGGVSLFCLDRVMYEPIIMAGGPAVTNPVPLAPFVDVTFIGEAEGRLKRMFTRLAEMKRKGAHRQDMLAYLLEEPSAWSASKTGTARRSVWNEFGDSKSKSTECINTGASKGANRTWNPTFPVPNIRTVQDHGVVEVMRGCPNGCRFCLAGIFYRPFRLKQPEAVLHEAEDLVFGCGYREITLSSLSTGDYPGISDLVGALNRRFEQHRVSFPLPSLRINSLTLNLLSELSSVRKSGLTFAVETPLEEWQRGINKLAPLERTVEILREAHGRGWKLAKFYFMVGLPVIGDRDETGPIIDLLTRIKSETGMSLNVNITTFIPKPHTPFQWAPQLTERDALDKIMSIKRSLSGRGFKIIYHSPFLSLIEGMISRGDERAGDLVHRAFTRGARLDAWEEYIRWDIWRSVFKEAEWNVEEEICREREPAEKLPWESVSLGVTLKYLRQEYELSQQGELTCACSADCTHNCGVCGNDSRVKDRIAPLKAEEAGLKLPSWAGNAQRILFSFTKLGRAVFLGHLNVMQIFERAFLRAGYSALFTQGFNPKPRLEFANPLSLGIASQEEIAAIVVQDYDSEEEFCRRLDRTLPEGFKIRAVRPFDPRREGGKRASLMSLYWGSDFLIKDENGTGLIENVHEALNNTGSHALTGVRSFSCTPGGIEIRYKQSEKGAGNILRLLERLGVADPLKTDLMITRLAVLANSRDGEPVSYFDLSP